MQTIFTTEKHLIALFSDSLERKTLQWKCPREKSGVELSCFLAWKEPCNYQELSLNAYCRYRRVSTNLFFTTFHLYISNMTKNPKLWEQNTHMLPTRVLICRETLPQLWQAILPHPLSSGQLLDYLLSHSRYARQKASLRFLTKKPQFAGLWWWA